MKAIWIPVEDRLPEDNEYGFNRVIVCDAEGNVFQGSYDHEMQRWYGNDYCRIPDDGKERVIAWCEFPEPYKPLSISPSALNLRENYGGTH
jgi:hypothetical protein